MELNPGHPVTTALHDEWYKLCAILVFKMGGKHVITAEDLVALEKLFPGEMPCLLAHSKKDGIYLSLLPESEARKKGWA